MHRPLNEVVKEIRVLISKGDYNEIIPFIGAGSSMPLQLPNWKELVKNYHNAVNCEIDFDKLRRDYNEDWPAISDLIYKDSGENMSAYKEFMAKTFLPKACEYTNVHLAVIDNYKKIITTNFDRAFEDALNYKINDQNYPKKVREDYHFSSLIYAQNLNPNYFNGRCIAYLHGHMDSNLYVFRSVEYGLAYENNGDIMTFLRTVITAYPIIFLGFSFDDIIFRDKLRQILIEEQIKAEKIEKIHGTQDNNSKMPKLYVIINEKQVNELVSNHDIIYFFDNNLEVLDGLIEIKQIDNNEWLIDPIEDFVYIRSKLSTILDKNKVDKFHDLLIELKKIKERNKYFEDLGIEVLKYPGAHTAMSSILEQIAVKETSYENDTESLPSTI